MPKISEAFRRKPMPLRMGGDPSARGPTVRLSTSRTSDRSISQASVDPVARLLQRGTHQIDRGQRDGEEYSWTGRDPPGVDQVLAGVGDDAAEARRRRLDAQP